MIMGWPPRASGSVVDEPWRKRGRARGAGAHACVKTCTKRVLDRAFPAPINPPNCHGYTGCRGCCEWDVRERTCKKQLTLETFVWPHINARDIRLATH